MMVAWLVPLISAIAGIASAAPPIISLFKKSKTQSPIKPPTIQRLQSPAQTDWKNKVPDANTLSMGALDPANTGRSLLTGG